MGDERDDPLYKAVMRPRSKSVDDGEIVMRMPNTLTPALERALLTLDDTPVDKSISWSVRFGYRLERLGLARRTLLSDRTVLTPLGLETKRRLLAQPQNSITRAAYVQQAHAAIAALVPQEEEVGRMVERLRNRIHDAPMETEHLLDDAADLLERLVGKQGK